MFNDQVHHIFPKELYKRGDGIGKTARLIEMDSVENLVELKAHCGSHRTYTEIIADCLENFIMNTGGDEQGCLLLAARKLKSLLQGVSGSIEIYAEQPYGKNEIRACFGGGPLPKETTITRGGRISKPPSSFGSE